MAGFDISGVESSGSATIVSVTFTDLSHCSTEMRDQFIDNGTAYGKA
jgi:hypothetical protein